jgi:hypothetical protein
MSGNLLNAGGDCNRAGEAPSNVSPCPEVRICAIYVCRDPSIARRPRPARVSERLRSDDRRADPLSPSVGHFRRSRSHGCMPGLAVPSFSVRSDSHLCPKSSLVVPDRRPSGRKASSAGNGPLQRFGHRRRAFLNNSLIAVGMPAVCCRLSIDSSGSDAKSRDQRLTFLR